MRRFVPKKSGSGDDTALLIGQPTASDYNGSGGGAVTPLQWLFGALAIGTLLAVIVAAAVIGSSVSTIDQHVNSLTTLTTSVNTSVGARVGGIATVILNGSCTAQPSIEARRTRAYNVRLANAFRQYTKPIDCHVSNGDESAYASTRFASYSKGLQHDSTLGHVLPSSYNALLKATATELPSDWDAVPLAPNASRKLTSPQSGSAYTNEGGDAQSFVIPPAPTFSSAEQAAELVENYWAALLRDVPFANYTTHPLALQAVADLTAMSDYRGPLPITGQTLFRGTSPGSTVGPYLSQFFYLPCQFGANIVEQKIKTLAPGIDYMTNWTEYVRVQNGQTPSAAVTILPTPVYMDSGRDLSHWVHIDVLFQAYFQAMLCLLNMGAPLKPGIPYQTSELNQMGFATFGPPWIAQMSTNAPIAALKAVWYQKWFVHRRLRPEVMGARVDRHKKGLYTYPIHADLLNSAVLALINTTYNGSYLLPQAFPEGSPLHPSYGAGHATVAGVSVTLLKVIFDEDYVIPAPLMPNPADGGLTVVPLSPPATLTVGGELNKIAENVAIGRNIAGVHWRSDARESLLLGERVAITVLQDMKNTFNEPGATFSFRGFNGNLVVV